jgi:folate-binding Fe-S cluster repair protein YgfZ
MMSNEGGAGPAQQYGTLVNAAGCAVVERSQVKLTGKDRATLLHKFCTQDVLARKPGEGAEAFLLNVQGKILAYVFFFVCDDAIVLDTAAGQSAVIIQHLDRYVIREDVKFADRRDHRKSHGRLASKSNAGTYRWQGRRCGRVG